MSRAAVDLRAEVLLADCAAPVPEARREPLGQVRFIIDEPTRIHLEAVSSAPGYLLLMDTWFPGWKARVDGRGETRPSRRLCLPRGATRSRSPPHRARIPARLASVGCRDHGLRIATRRGAPGLGPAAIEVVSDLDRWRSRRHRRGARHDSPSRTLAAVASAPFREPRRGHGWSTSVVRVAQGARAAREADRPPVVRSLTAGGPLLPHRGGCLVAESQAARALLVRVRAAACRGALARSEGGRLGATDGDPDEARRGPAPVLDLAHAARAPTGATSCADGGRPVADGAGWTIAGLGGLSALACSLVLMTPRIFATL